MRHILKYTAVSNLAKRMADDSVTALEKDSRDIAEGVMRLENSMNAREKELRAHHMARLTQKKCSPEFTVIYTDVIHDIEKIGDYCTNIADAVINSTNFNTVKSKVE